LRSVALGTLASLFFATTFILNRVMSVAGGSWIWSASLRYLFMIPLLVVIVGIRGGLSSMFQEIMKNTRQWFLWSCVGFGLFYVPMCLATVYSPAWLVAGTWQFTIIAGSLLVPLFYEIRQTADGPMKVRQRIPMQGLALSLIIIAGIIVMQWQQSGHFSIRNLLLGIIPVVIASFAYPLGNRQMMVVCQGRLDAYQRVLGMTLVTLPVWALLAMIGTITAGPPSHAQLFQSFVVAVCSGVVATVLFFAATDLAKGNPQQLAQVEATQSTEVVFTMLGESAFITGTFPSWPAIMGIALVVAGMVCHSLFGHGPRRQPKPLADSNHLSSDIFL
jgi:drug/metabolite transporter (DMT)-like permease